MNPSENLTKACTYRQRLYFDTSEFNFKFVTETRGQVGMSYLKED